MRRRKKPTQTERFLLYSLRWRLTCFVLLVMLMAGVLTGLGYALVLSLFAHNPIVLAVTLNPLFAAMVLLGACSVFGTILAAFWGKQYLRPLRRLIVATKEVRKGNFKVQVKEERGHLSEMGNLIRSFNAMVRELDSIELFRNDFINNFSHEFKTPIV